MTETDPRNTNRQRIVIFVACVLIAALLHFVIRQHYPPNIDRSKWMAAFVLLATRNGFAGAAIGTVLGRPWIGFATGVVIPPIVIVMLYGLPG